MNKKSVILICAALGVAQSLNINSIEIQGSQGKDDENPIEEDNSFSLRCSLSDTDWIHCGWSHVVEDELGNDNQDLNVYCAASSPSDNGKTCENSAGNAESDYYERLTLEVSGTNCGLRIRDAHPWDNGRWKCHAAGFSTGQDFKEVEVFVSNKSSMVIKDPDLEDDDSQVIVYDLDSSRPEIEAKCRAYGGIPEPSFIWYFNDDGNEIDSGDYQPRINRGTDPIYGDYIEESISWEPSIDDMCDKYDLDEHVCDSKKARDNKKNWEFNFNLLCQADQGNYYTDENEEGRAEVIVEVTNGAMATTVGNLALFSATAILSWRFGLSS